MFVGEGGIFTTLYLSSIRSRHFLKTRCMTHSIRWYRVAASLPVRGRRTPSRLPDLSHPTTTNAQERVAIFWDYENCAVSDVPGGEVVSNIRRIANQYGSTILFKTYLDVTEQASSKTSSFRAELQSSGVSVTDCPHLGRKGVVDNMIMVDMLTFAIDNPAPATLILISGDQDFIYAVSVLQLRQYRVVLIAPSQSSNKLCHQATVFLEWETVAYGEKRLRWKAMPTPASPPPRIFQSTLSSQVVPTRTLSPDTVAAVPTDPSQDTTSVDDLSNSTAITVVTDTERETRLADSDVLAERTISPGAVFHTDDAEGVRKVADVDAQKLPDDSAQNDVPRAQRGKPFLDALRTIIQNEDENSTMGRPADDTDLDVSTDVGSSPKIDDLFPFNPYRPDPEVLMQSFSPLLRILIALKAAGVEQPTRNDIKYQISQDPNALRNAGSQYWWEYLQKAQQVNVVTLGGGTGVNSWLSLSSAWQDVPYSSIPLMYVNTSGDGSLTEDVADNLPKGRYQPGDPLPSKIQPYERLIQILATMKDNDVLQPPRTAIALMLMRSHPDALNATNTYTWNQYLLRAEHLGVITTGGVLGDRWVALNPPWDEVSAKT